MAKTRYEADSSSAVRAQKSLTKALDEYDKKVGSTTKKLSKAERAAKSLAKQADPTKRHAAQMNKLAVAVKEGGLQLSHAERLAKKYTQQLDRAGGAGKKAFGSKLVQDLGSLVAGFASVGGAIAGVTREIDEARQAAERATEKQRTASQARRGLKINIAAADAKIQKTVLSEADDIADKLQLPQALVDSVVADAVSAAPTVDRAVSFARVGLRAVRDLPGSADFVGGVLDVGNILDTDDPTLALGFLNRTQRLNRATDVRKLAENLPRVLGAGKAAGLDLGTSAAIFNALTVASADKNTQVARTASIGILDKSRRFFLDAAKEGRFAAEDVDTTKERLDKLLADPDLAREFIDTSGFRAAAKGGIQTLFLFPDSEARNTYNLSKTDLSNLDDVRAAGAKGLEFLDKDDVGAASRSIRAVSGNAILRADSVLGQEDKIAVDDLVQRLNTLGGKYSSRVVSSASRFLSTNFDGYYSPGEAADYLEGRLSATENAVTAHHSYDGTLTTPQRQEGYDELAILVRDLIATLREEGVKPRE